MISRMLDYASSPSKYGPDVCALMPPVVVLPVPGSWLACGCVEFGSGTSEERLLGYSWDWETEMKTLYRNLSEWIPDTVVCRKSWKYHAWLSGSASPCPIIPYPEDARLPFESPALGPGEVSASSFVVLLRSSWVGFIRRASFFLTNHWFWWFCLSFLMLHFSR